MNDACEIEFLVKYAQQILISNVQNYALHTRLTKGDVYFDITFQPKEEIDDKMKLYIGHKV